MKNQTALILMPHGSHDPQWADAFRRLADDLRADLGPDAVYLAFMEIASPGLKEAAAAMEGASIRQGRILPLFMARGSHYTTTIPRQIAEVKAAFPGLELELLEPIGLHPRFFSLMRELIKSL